jgi:tRNA(fMet)-specific endonuclease VapC
MILLDTDILSLLLAGHVSVGARLRVAEDDVAISVITKVEILRGRFDFLLKAADGGQLERAQLWLDQLEDELHGWNVIRVNGAVAAEFDRLRQMKNLQRIGRADLLMASIACAHRAILVTRNLRHFRQIPGLMLENWAD